MVYSELGCIPIADKLKFKVLDYVVKVCVEPEKDIPRMALMELKRIDSRYWQFISNFISNDIDIFNFADETPIFIKKVNSKIKNEVVQKSKDFLLENMKNNSKCIFYLRVVKEETFFGFQKYLDF